MSNHVRYEHKEDTGTFIYCDSLLINPYIPAISYEEYHKMLFIIKDAANHTWIIDNKGKVVYNTDEDYEYDIRYMPSGEVNHHIIKIKNKKRKFIANIHWPGFNGQPFYTEFYILNLIDSFMVVKPRDEYGTAVMDKSYNFITPFERDRIWPITIIKNGKLTHWFYTQADGNVYDGSGQLLFTGVYWQFRDFNNSLGYFGKLRDEVDKKLIYFDKYGTIYRDK